MLASKQHLTKKNEIGVQRHDKGVDQKMAIDEALPWWHSTKEMINFGKREATLKELKFNLRIINIHEMTLCIDHLKCVFGKLIQKFLVSINGRSQ